MILDTNALSALADGDSGLLRVLGRRTELALPVVVLGEYLFGIRQSRHRAEYEAWLTRIRSGVQMLEIAERTASHYADVRRELRAAGRPIRTNAVWIAALAREHRMPVVSSDRHFAAVEGLRLVTW